MEVTDLGKKLRGLRAENKLPLHKVATLLNQEKNIKIHRETLRKYEKDATKIPANLLISLLEVYNIEPTIFFKNVYDYCHNKEEK